MKGKKEILRISQLRDYLLIITHQNFRFLRDSWVGIINGSDFGAFSHLTMYDFSNASSQSLMALSGVNQNLMKKAEAINEEVRNELFHQNIEINYTNANSQQSTISFTTFQATNQIIETGFKLLRAGNMNILERREALEYIFKNAANDLLLTTESTSDLFFESIGTVIEDRRGKTYEYMVSRIILLVITFILLVWVTRKKYLEEKKQLTALIKLDNQVVAALQEKITDFRANIEMENLKEPKSVLKSLKTRKKLVLAKKQEIKNRLQDPNAKKIFRKYFVYLGEAFAIFCIVIGFIIWISVSAISSNEVLRVEQEKLYFADNMIITINLALLASQELYATNNSAIILNINASSVLENTISGLNAIRNRAMKELSYEDGSYDSIVEDILFDNGCQLLNSTLTGVSYCSVLDSKALKTNLITLLSNYEAAMKEKLETFENSRYDAASLKTERMRDFDLILSLQKVLGDESSLIATRINNNFETIFVDLGDVRNLISDIFYVAIAVSAILCWILVFQKLINADNKFKIVLQAFPSSLIMSNFILKSFIIKTSGDTLSHRRFDA